MNQKTTWKETNKGKTTREWDWGARERESEREIDKDGDGKMKGKK